MRDVENEAWITSAVQDKIVQKAIALAESLRSVRTARKLVVVTTLAVSKDLREKLNEVFDLVLFMERVSRSPNGWHLEEYAIIRAFSLKIFRKCVYLSPNALAVRNCDDIFVKYGNFAAAYTSLNNIIDISAFLFTPRLINAGAFIKAVHSERRRVGNVREVGNSFSKALTAWLKNNGPTVQKLDDHYFVKLSLSGSTYRGSRRKSSLIDFAEVCALNIAKEMKKKSAVGDKVLQKVGALLCWITFVVFLQRADLRFSIGVDMKYRNLFYGKLNDGANFLVAPELKETECDFHPFFKKFRWTKWKWMAWMIKI